MQSSPVSAAPALSDAASPRVQGLTRYLEEAVRELRTRGPRPGARDGDGVLFLGNWHDAHPRLLFHDPVLEPVDKLVWAVIRHHADGKGATAFPSYQTIGRCANVRGKATIARAIMLLRVTRWLSLCARVRDPAGRFQGNVYALHDEPVTVQDACCLDGDYRVFLAQMTDYRHDRVRLVAGAVSDAIAAGDEASIAEQTVQNLNRSGRVQNSVMAVNNRVQNLPRGEKPRQRLWY